MQRLARILFWSAAVLALAMAMVGQALSLLDGIDDTVQHALAFGTLAALAALAYPETRRLTILLGLSVFGGVIELLQVLPGVDRDAEWGDWLVDIVAAALTLGVLGWTRSTRTPALS